MAAEFLATMGEKIRTRRIEKGLTQEDVARQMPGRVTGARVSLWERGKHRPHDDSLEALAQVLDVPVSYFMAPAPARRATTTTRGSWWGPGSRRSGSTSAVMGPATGRWTAG